MANWSVLKERNGTMPLGSIIAIATNLSGARTAPATGVVDSKGWQYCDGAAVAASQNITGTTPNLTDSRFLMGFTSAGSTGGAASVTLTTTELPAHAHTSAAHTHTLVHTHTLSGTTGAGGAHTHGIKATSERTPTSASGGSGVRFLDDAGGVTFVSNSEASHTHSFSTTSDGASTTTTSSTTPADTGSAGSGTAFAILPTYVKTQYLIRVK